MSQSMKVFTRGGQTFLHGYRMIMQVLRKLLLAVLILFVVASTGLFLEISTQQERMFGELWVKAGVLSSINPKTPVRFSANHDRSISVASEDLLQWVVKQPSFLVMKTALFDALFWGFLLSLGSAVSLTSWLIWRGKRLEKPTLIQGRYQGTVRELTRKMQQLGELSDLTIAGVPIFKGSETQHILIHGTPGSGKSVSMRAILDQIKQRGDKAIIYDRHGDYVQYYFDPQKDKLLNPLDARCEPWDIWAECKDLSDYDSLSAALMPMPLGQSSDPFWVNAARTIFAASAYQLRSQEDCSTDKLLQLLLMSDLDQLSTMLKGTEAESLVSEKAAKTALSVKSVLATYLKSFKYLKHSDNPFSIRQWLQQEDEKSWLYITSRSDKHEALKPLISVWLDLAANGLMSLSPNSERRVWLIIDELPSLQRLPYLPQAFAESRKFGGCIVAGLQNYFQLQHIYGVDGAKDMVDLCNTRLFLRAPSNDSAKWVSKELGECEIVEVREGMSYGANTMRDGVSLNHQRLTKLTVTSTEVMNLPDLQGYLSIAPNKSHYEKAVDIIKCWPVVRVTIPYIEKQAAQPIFCSVSQVCEIKEKITLSPVRVVEEIGKTPLHVRKLDLLLSNKKEVFFSDIPRM